MTTDHENLLGTLEQRVLQVSAWTLVALFTPLFVLIQWGEYVQGRYDAILAAQAVLHAVSCGLVVVLRNQKLRAGVLIAYLLLSSLVVLLHYGPNVSVGMVWVVTLILGFIYLDTKGLVLSIVAILLTMAAAAVGHQLNPSLYTEAGDVHLLSTWFRLTATSAVLLTGVAMVITAIIRGFANAAQAASLALERERAERAEREAAQEAQRKAERAMADAQRQEVLGRLAAGAAHDLNNVLTAILGASEVATLRPSRAPVELARIRDATQQAAAMARQLLAFSKPQVTQTQVVNAVASLQGMSRLLDRLLPSNIQHALVLPGSPVLVELRPSQLEQVVLNLCINARDAMPRGGMLSITLRVEEDGWPWIGVSDTGEGMDEEVQQHIFEPYFTTRGDARGTGLGLATVQSIVRDWGGEIEVHSQPGRGSTLRVRLPALASGAELLLDAPTEEQLLRGTERVLVVDDDPTVLELARRLLADAGYATDEASRGSEALALLDRKPVDLVILDAIMPGLSGTTLVERLRAAHPEVRLLFSTGYDPEVFGVEALGAESQQILAKPYTRSQLLRAVRAALDAPPSPAPDGSG